MSKSATDKKIDAWLMLVLTIPGHQPALRMRLWRKLKAAGVGVLRDGVYVAPANSALHALFAAQTEELIATGGTAQLLTLDAHTNNFSTLFDRGAEYRELLAGIAALAKSLKTSGAKRLATKLDLLRREFESISSRDFFPGAPQKAARAAIDDLSDRILRKLTPDEPHASHKRLQKLERDEYRGRVWATRARPWVDRLASAWLIKRFVDPKARIEWLKDTARKPANALGFDFDGADFTHIDDKVTFEVLLHSFGLEADATLAQVAAVVHYLDVGGIPVAEAPAIETILRGMRLRTRDDSALLFEASRLLDDLYAGFQESAKS